eukprot:4650562-Prymnesium_polylepis.1
MAAVGARTAETVVMAVVPAVPAEALAAHQTARATPAQPSTSSSSGRLLCGTGSRCRTWRPHTPAGGVRPLERIDAPGEPGRQCRQHCCSEARVGGVRLPPARVARAGGNAIAGRVVEGAEKSRIRLGAPVYDQPLGFREKVSVAGEILCGPAIVAKVLQREHGASRLLGCRRVHDMGVIWLRLP